MLPTTTFEWIMVIWFYATNVIGPMIVFVLVVLTAVMVVRINGRLKRRDRAAGASSAMPTAGVASQREAAQEAGDANGSTDVARAADAERARLARKLERARRATDLADQGLTRRERTVLLAACEGRTFATLAEELGVSRSTVGTYCTRAYEKLGVSSREEAQAWLARRAFAHRLEDAGLTEGEVEVALAVADGASAADVAASLVLSEAAVKSRLQQAYAKLGIHSRADLVRLREAAVA